MRTADGLAHGTGDVGSPEVVLRHARERPTSPAVEDDVEALTYAALAERVAAVASGLAELGVQPGDRVVLHLPASAAFVELALGCAWIGAPFVPVSPDDPPRRRAGIVADADPALVVIADGGDPPPVGAPPGRRPARVLDVGTVLGSAGSVPDRAHDPERDLYFVYTSGTTGAPKGVRAPERAFRTAIVSAAAAMHLGPATRTLSVSPFHFDGAYGTAFATLAAGGALLVPRREDLLFLRRFFRAVVEDGITHTGCSPTYLRLLLSSPAATGLAGSSLRSLGLGGEECAARDVARIWEILPDLRVYNLYGPTETTIAVTAAAVARRDVESGRIPIGTPHPGTSFHVVGRDGRVVEAAEATGELYIGGPQLMAGYWRDPTLTARVLRRDVVPGTTLYRTGDLVHRDRQGRYVFAGRRDDVLKRRGVRLSLTEIERALTDIDGVSAAVCVPVDRDGEVEVSAAVVAGGGATEAGLRQMAGARLPAAMLPDRIVVVPSLPTTSTGKVDRRRLREVVARTP